MQFHGNQFLKSGSTEWIFLPLFQGEMPKSETPGKAGGLSCEPLKAV